MSAAPSANYLEAITYLMTETRNYLNGLDLIPRQDSAADSILLGLLSKSIVQTEAIVFLIAKGFEEEAFGLCRTNIEIQLTIRYLTNRDTIQRCRRYFYYFAKDKNEWFKLIHKYYPDMKLKVRDDAPNLEKLAAAYKSPHKWHDCPNGLKDFAAEVDSFETREDGSPLDALFYYEILYKWMSHYVHVTEPSIESTHVTLPGDSFRVHPGAGTSRLGNKALRPAFLSVHLNLLRVLRYLNMEYPEIMAGKYEAIVSEYLR